MSATSFPAHIHSLVLDHFHTPQNAVEAIYQGVWLDGQLNTIDVIQSQSGVFGTVLSQVEIPCVCHSSATPEVGKAVGVRFSTVARKILSYGEQHGMLKENRPSTAFKSTKVRFHQIAILVHHTMVLAKPLMTVLNDWVNDLGNHWVLHRCGNGMLDGPTCTTPAHLVFGNNKRNEEHKHFHWASNKLLSSGHTDSYNSLRQIHNLIQQDNLF